MIEITFLAACR